MFSLDYISECVVTACLAYAYPQPIILAVTCGRYGFRISVSISSETFYPSLSIFAKLRSILLLVTESNATGASTSGVSWCPNTARVPYCEASHVKIIRFRVSKWTRKVSYDKNILTSVKAVCAHSHGVPFSNILCSDSVIANEDVIKTRLEILLERTHV